MIILIPFTSFQLNGLVYAPACDGTNDGFCYNAETTDGGAILNCLHGGACPQGVSYEIDEPTTTTETTTTTTEPTPIVDLGDTDGDGILNNVDLCIDEPETVNGFLDSDGCPETINSVNQTYETVEPTITIENIIVDPPTFTPTITPIDDTGLSINLNGIVNNAIVIYIIIVVLLIVVLIVILKRHYMK